VSEISNLIGQYGFPIVAAVGMGYFIYYVWKWVTTQVKPVLGEANGTLIGLIDRIRMLDNDLIRLNQKLSVVLQLREQELQELRAKNRKLKRQIDDKNDGEKQ
tara:strand:- start:1759 stop:2067 length:309 start_codon:yes stop_codon:yes gene_type:complete